MLKIKMAGVATYLAGAITGTLITGAFYFGQHSVMADPPASTNAKVYADIPKNHWAAQSVADLKQKGILQGQTTDTFRGDQYVTRYEAAVLIDRFVHYVEDGRKPLNATTADPKTMPIFPPGPTKDSLNDLAVNRYLPLNSALFASPGTARVTADQFSLAFAQAVDRVTDRSLSVGPAG